MKIGITGGIGSGKSYVCQRLIARGYEVYDCDNAAKRLMRTSPEIRQQLTALIGPDTYLEVRGFRAFLYLSAAKSHTILPIIHTDILSILQSKR